MNQMNDDQLDDALADLKSELSIDPSPEFATKVRQQIDQAPARSFWNLWTWASVAATCAVVFVAGSLWLRSFEIVVPGTPTTDPIAAPSIAQHMTTTPTPTITPTRTPTAPTRTVVASNHSVAPKEHELEVLVPPDQLDAIRRLMAAVKARSVSEMPAMPTVIDPDTGELIKLKPIEIPLITVEPLPVGPDGRSGGSERK